jgi:serine/threonine-protein kinase HipA
MNGVPLLKNNKVIGEIRRFPDRNEFRLETSEFIALHFPKNGDQFPPDHLPNFLINLLPEGARLALLLQSQRGAQDDTLSLLERIGHDTIGDISVQPTQTREKEIVDYREINFFEHFEHINTISDADASIPGVQEKISSATITTPLRTRKWESAILKLTPKQYPFLVENESCFMEIAKQCGIEVAETSLIKDRDENTGLLVRRFDRQSLGETIEKHHQEDGCQILNIPPSWKYRVSFQQIAEQFEALTPAPKASLKSLLDLYIYSYLIGNADLHAKNVSLLWRNETIQTSPGYDLLSTLPYKKLGTRMALPLYGKDDNFKTKQFLRFADSFQIPEKIVLRSIQKMTQVIRKNFPQIESIGYDEKTTSNTLSQIQKRIDNLG